MMLYASSCDLPSNRSARVFLPSSVSNSYSFSTGTHGSSSRFLLISSFRSACSASSFANSSRAACHSSRVPILCPAISFPSVSSVALADSTSRPQVTPTPITTSDRPQTHREGGRHAGRRNKASSKQSVDDELFCLFVRGMVRRSSSLDHAEYPVDKQVGKRKQSAAQA